MAEYGTLDFGPSVETRHIAGRDYGLRISLLESWLQGRDPLPRQELAERFRRGSGFDLLAHP